MVDVTREPDREASEEAPITSETPVQSGAAAEISAGVAQSAEKVSASALLEIFNEMWVLKCSDSPLIEQKAALVALLALAGQRESELKILREFLPLLFETNKVGKKKEVGLVYSEAMIPAYIQVLDACSARYPELAELIDSLMHLLQDEFLLRFDDGSSPLRDAAHAALYYVLFPRFHIEPEREIEIKAILKKIVVDEIIYKIKTIEDSRIDFAAMKRSAAQCEVALPLEQMQAAAQNLIEGLEGKFRELDDFKGRPLKDLLGKASRLSYQIGDREKKIIGCQYEFPEVTLQAGGKKIESTQEYFAGQKTRLRELMRQHIELATRQFVGALRDSINDARNMKEMLVGHIGGELYMSSAVLCSELANVQDAEETFEVSGGVAPLMQEFLRDAVRPKISACATQLAGADAKEQEKISDEIKDLLDINLFINRKFPAEKV